MQYIDLFSGKLYYGPFPTFQSLAGKHFDIIFNLGAELSGLKSMEELYCNKVLLANIKDFGIPTDISSFRSQVNEVISSLQGGNDVFIHCKGGVGRTGAVLAVLYKEAFKCSSDEALDTVYYLVGGPETDEQFEFVEKF